MLKILLLFIGLPCMVIGQKQKLLINYGHTNVVYEPRFSKDGKYIITFSDDQSVKLWERNTGKLIRTFFSEGGRVTDAQLSDNNSILALRDFDMNMIAWYDVRSEKLIRKLQTMNHLIIHYLACHQE